MIDLGRHRALTHDAWNELVVRAAIEEIAADAIANFHADAFWPLHPSDEGVGDGNPSFYRGAAGVIWASDYLHRVGAIRVAQDFRPVLPRLMERTLVDFESNAPTGYTKHGSLLRGDMGAALLTMRLAPTSNVSDLVHRRAEANNELPIRELMWGMPGSMVAAIHMAEMTQEPRWRELFEVQAARLLADLEDTPQGPLWTQDLYGQRDRFLGPVRLPGITRTIPLPSICLAVGLSPFLMPSSSLETANFESALPLIESDGTEATSDALS